MKLIYLSIIFLIMCFTTANSQISVTFNSDSTTIWDANIAYNCAARFDVSVSFSSDTIYIVELDTMPRATCSCYYTVSTSLHGLSVGTYHAMIYRHFKDGPNFDKMVFAGSTTFTISAPPVVSANITYKSSGCYQSPQSVSEDNSIPQSFVMLSNYSNPFNPGTVIRYSVPRTGSVSLAIFNMTGQIVEVLVDGVKHAGTYEMYYDATGLSTGVYMCRLIVGRQILSNKIVVLK
jgi:hypothetical protein